MQYSPERSKLLFVVNPISGGRKKINWETEIREYFAGSDHQVEMLVLNGGNDGWKIYEKIKTGQPDKVIAVGGDGTIKLVVEQLLGTDIPLGIIPAGSANGLAREFDLPASLKDALAVVMKDNIRTVDLIKINDKEICVHLSDMGLNARVVKYYAMGGVRGKWGYARAIWRVLWQRQLISAEILVNGQQLKREAFMVVIANARTYGTGALINPSGNISDGLFEVVVVKELSVWELLKMIVTHKPFDPRKIEVLKTTEARVNIRKRGYFQVDGEYRGKQPSVHARILPAALRLLLPREDKK
ncbi:MAG: NAD(+)/NADH kinase [Chitinophagaceae bacterium]|nr:NAD(+)/NADH kinase [Chitinophagaceae bacterium]